MISILKRIIEMYRSWRNVTLPPRFNWPDQSNPFIDFAEAISVHMRPIPSPQTISALSHL